ncbi:MAG: ATP-binding cassette domain-containing protein, partial [Deltaproteobacteria bacterium]|nr:ATP-binding cassette domain-containing protein [Deltaproteobacteria bacterium]
MARAPDPASGLPTTLGGQLVRQGDRFAVGLLLLAAYQASQYWFDTRLSIAIDSAVHGDAGAATRIGVELVVVSLAALFIRVLSRVAIFNGGRIAEYELRRALLAKLQTLGPSFYRRMSTGDIMSRATNDLGQIRLVLGFGVLNGINTAFALVSALAVMIGISGRLTVAALLSLPLLFVAMAGFARAMFARQREFQDATGAMAGLVQSSIAGVRVIRSFALEDAELRRFDAENESYLDKTLALARLRGLMFPVMQSITAVGAVVVLWYGGTLLLDGAISAGAFLAFYRALSRLTWPLVSLGFLSSMIQRGRASFSRLAEVFDAAPDIVGGDRLPAAEGRGHLSVRGLSFSHGEYRVLDDVHFEVGPGELVAVVGRTGSGKSTLAALLPRLLPTPRGAIFLDGEDIADL